MDTFEFLTNIRYSMDPRTTMNRLKCSDWLVRHFRIDKRIAHHQGCVNSICWSDEQSSWSVVLSAGDDRCLILSDVNSGERLASVETNHADNIFCARFLFKSCEGRVVSCSSDGMVIFTDLNRPTQTSSFNCCVGRGPVYELRPFPECSNVFLSCAEDGTVRLYDLRIGAGCVAGGGSSNPSAGGLNRTRVGRSHANCVKHVLIDCQCGVNSMDICPSRHHELAIGASDGLVRLYDIRRTRRPFGVSRPPPPTTITAAQQQSGARRNTKCRITCTKYNSTGEELLASFSAGDICLYYPRQLDQAINQFGMATSTTESDEAAGRGGGQGDDESSRSRFPKRLRIRGDWSDTGPDSRPIRESSGGVVDRLANVMYQLLLPPPSNNQPNNRNNNNNQASRSARATTRGYSEETPLSFNHEQRVIERLMDDMTRRVSNANDDDDDQNHSESSSASLSDEDSNLEIASAEDELSSSDNLGSTELSRTDILIRGIISRRHRRERDCFHRRSQQRISNCGGVGLLSGSSSAGNVSSQRHNYHVGQIKVIKRFSGHRNVRTVIKECAFWGDNHIMSGSDCGHVFIWNKTDARIVAIYEGDTRVVNCVQPHPSEDILTFASSGIDHDVKIWQVCGKCTQDPMKIHRIVNINRVMTDETQNTVTVPAPIIFRLLTTFSRSRMLRTFDSSLED